MSPTSALRIRHRLAGLADSAHKQIALRRIRDARALERRGAETQDRVAELIAEAAFLLPYAEAMDARDHPLSRAID